MAETMTHPTSCEPSEASAPMVRKKFNTLTLGIFAILLPNAWAFAAKGLVIGIYGGGLPVLIWSSLIVGIILSLLTLSFAEFGSAFPSVAGCNMIATKLGGPKYGRVCGFFTGGIHAIAAMITPACLAAAHMPLVTTMAMIMHPTWQPQKWHNFLLYQVVTAMITLTCLKGSRFLEKLALVGGTVLFALFFTVIGVVLGGPDELAPHHIVWNKIENETGWGNGIAFLLGASSPLAGYGPTHWMLNMAEDVQNPRRAIPLAMLMQQMGSVSTLFVLFIVLGYGVGADWQSITSTPYTAPLGAIFETATGSKAAATTLMALMFSLAIVTAASYTSAAARLIYGFAKSGALPCQSWLTRYSNRDQVPRHALYLIYGFNVVLGFTLLGSSSGLPTLVGAATLMFSLGYLPMFAGYLLTGGQYLTKQGWFRLPRTVSLGLASFNVLSVLAQSVVLCLPPANPITPENMNWASVIGAALLLFLVAIYVFYGRARYQVDDDLIIAEDEVIQSVHVALGADAETRSIAKDK